MSRSLAAMLLVALAACECGGMPATAPQTGVVDLPGGGKRVTLTANYVESLEGEGWDLAAGRITPDPTGADFFLRVTMVVALTYAEQPASFCAQQPAAGAPAFARVEDVPGDAAACTTWSSAQLGGTFVHTDTVWAGQAYLFRDRTGADAAKLLIVADHVTDGADVGITFDIIGLR